MARSYLNWNNDYKKKKQIKIYFCFYLSKWGNMKEKSNFPAEHVLWFLELSRVCLWRNCGCCLITCLIQQKWKHSACILEKTNWPSYGWRVSWRETVYSYLLRTMFVTCCQIVPLWGSPPWGCQRSYITTHVETGLVLTGQGSGCGWRRKFTSGWDRLP